MYFMVVEAEQFYNRIHNIARDDMMTLQASNHVLCNV